MLGLVSYDSDEDGNEQVEAARMDGQNNATASAPPPSNPEPIAQSEPPADPALSTAPPAPSAEDTVTPGPAVGPSMPRDQPKYASNDNDEPPRSPYSTSRAAIRNLTMPRIPNFDIPPSPPGSPPVGPTKRFDHFLKLKKKGVHFNEKLENSSALRNPSLLQKLMDLAEMDEKDQYATTLPEHVAAPIGFPPWAYADQLAKRQEKMRRKQGEAVDFVAPSATATAGASGATKDNVHNAENGKKRDLERRGGRFDLQEKKRFKS